MSGDDRDEGLDWRFTTAVIVVCITVLLLGGPLAREIAETVLDVVVSDE